MKVNIPKWDHLWDGFIQEETQRVYVHRSSSTCNEKETFSITAKGKNKSKKYSKGGNKKKGERKKEMRKVKLFSCHKFGNYARQCPNKKNK
jgi:hypothetical protein